MRAQRPPKPSRDWRRRWVFVLCVALPFAILISARAQAPANGAEAPPAGFHDLYYGAHLATDRADSRALDIAEQLIADGRFAEAFPLVDRVLAARMAESDAGAIAQIHFAQRIMAALLAIGTSSLAVVAFPQLAEQLAGRGKGGFVEHFAIAFRRLILVIVPITFGVGCFAVWIVRDLLQHRAFIAEDSQMVGWLLALHLGMFIGASGAELFARGFYVLGDSRTPTAIGVVALLIAWGLKLWMFKLVGIWGIPIGVSAYCLLSASGMAWWLSRRCGTELWLNAGTCLLHSCLAAAIACLCSWGAYEMVPRGTWLAAPVGAVAYFATLMGLKNQDAQAVWCLLSTRLSRKTHA